MNALPTIATMRGERNANNVHVLAIANGYKRKKNNCLPACECVYSYNVIMHFKAKNCMITTKHVIIRIFVV